MFATAVLLVYAGTVFAFRMTTGEHIPRAEGLATMAWVGMLVAVARSDGLGGHQEALTAIVLCSGFVVWLRQVRGPSPGPESSLIDLQNRVVIVTGSNSGIGLETARALAARGATVVLACRTLKTAEQAKQSIVESTSNSKVHVLELDLSRYSSVHNFAKNFLERFGHLDILLHNAGVMNQSRVETEDGNEMMLQVNCFSVYLLTMLLYPALEKSQVEGGARVIAVGSSSHNNAILLEGGARFHDLHYRRKGEFSIARAYPHSKLALALLHTALSHLFVLNGSSVTFNCVSPGTVMTSITRDLHWILRICQPALLFSINKTPAAGSYTSVYAACSRDLNGRSGLYLEHCAAHAYKPEACNLEDALKMLRQAEARVLAVQR